MGREMQDEQVRKFNEVLDGHLARCSQLGLDWDRFRRAEPAPVSSQESNRIDAVKESWSPSCAGMKGAGRRPVDLGTRWRGTPLGRSSEPRMTPTPNGVVHATIFLVEEISFRSKIAELLDTRIAQDFDLHI